MGLNLPFPFPPISEPHPLLVSDSFRRGAQVSYLTNFLPNSISQPPPSYSLMQRNARDIVCRKKLTRNRLSLEKMCVRKVYYRKRENIVFYYSYFGRLYQKKIVSKYRFGILVIDCLQLLVFKCDIGRGITKNPISYFSTIKMIL